MELIDFLNQTQDDVRSEIGDRTSSAEGKSPYAESVFTEIVVQHMSAIGMTFDPHACHFAYRNGALRLSGYAISDDSEQLDLFVSLYSGTNQITTVPDSETKSAAEQCLRFLDACVKGKLSATVDESNEAYEFIVTIQHSYSSLDQIRIYVLTDRVAKAKNFKAREMAGKTVKLEVMDIERLHRHWSEGKPRDEVVVNFEEIAGTPLPCIYLPDPEADYDCLLTAIPAEALRILYDKYGQRLLEANVRSFLSATNKVNKGIRDTLRDAPQRFMAYNNGIVLVADEARLGKTADGAPAIVWMKGLQIVNGGQTTAAIYFAKKREPELNLKRVRVPAKVLVLRSQDSVAEEAVISDISRFANSQSAVKTSDLSANKPFHVTLEALAMTVYCPDGRGRWFYERAAGSYNVMLMREGSTPAKKKQLQESMPSSRRITKTDLAKYLNSWDQKPDAVSYGAQKNFQRFMADITDADGQLVIPMPDSAEYKRIISKVILFRKAQSITRSQFTAFYGNIAIYTVALFGNRLGDRLDLDRVWAQQDVSPELKEQLRAWSVEVNAVLQQSANGRMISEWRKSLNAGMPCATQATRLPPQSPRYAKAEPVFGTILVWGGSVSILLTAGDLLPFCFSSCTKLESEPSLPF